MLAICILTTVGKIFVSFRQAYVKWILAYADTGYKKEMQDNNRWGNKMYLMQS